MKYWLSCSSRTVRPDSSSKSLARFKCPSVRLSDVGQKVGASVLSQRGLRLRCPCESSSQRVASIVIQVAVVLKATDDNARVDADL